MIRRKLIAGNWKMNKTAADGVALTKDIVAEIGRIGTVDVVVCPPFTALESVAQALEGQSVKLGAQTGLFEDVPADGFMNGTPAVPFGLERRLVVLSRRLPDLFKKVDSLTASLDSARR